MAEQREPDALLATVHDRHRTTWTRFHTHGARHWWNPRRGWHTWDELDDPEPDDDTTNP